MDFRPMSPDEIERTMQFLLQQQAQLTADMAKHEAQSAETDARLTAKIDRVGDGLIGLTSIVGQLAAAQQTTEQRLRDTNTKVGELADQIKTVGSHLDVVIGMFERHLHEGHNPPPS